MTRSPVPRPFPTVTQGTQERGVLPRSPAYIAGNAGTPTTVTPAPRQP